MVTHCSAFPCAGNCREPAPLCQISIGYGSICTSESVNLVCRSLSCDLRNLICTLPLHSSNLNSQSATMLSGTMLRRSAFTGNPAMVAPVQVHLRNSQGLNSSNHMIWMPD